MIINFSKPEEVCNLSISFNGSQKLLSLAATAKTDDAEYAVFVSNEKKKAGTQNTEESAVFIFKVVTDNKKIVSIHNADNMISQKIFEEFSNRYG